MSRAEMMQILGLNPADFKPNQVTDRERIETIEEAIIELAEIVLGGEENG